MIDEFTYPQGDIQTWDTSTAELVSVHWPELDSIIDEGAGELHLASWKPSKMDLMSERAMMVAGLIPMDEASLDPKNRIVYRIRDKISGLTFLPTNPLRLNLSSLLPEDIEILNAGYARMLLHPSEHDKTHDLFNGEEGMRKWLQFPIKNYEAHSVEEIQEILDEISETVSVHRPICRLWMRGQRHDYPQTRSATATRILPFNKDIPSLIPSLGRYALKNPGKVDFGYAFFGPNHWWKKPFLIWFIRENPKWLEHYPEFVQRLDQSLKDSNDDIFAKILSDIIFDPKVPTEVDDLRQWFFAHYKYGSWIWVLQMYGYMASILDVTWDIDTALFFTQAQMVDGRFSLPMPSADRVIYVFVEWKTPSSFMDIRNVNWGDEDWTRRLPPRIERQNAACMIGSTWFRQNYYGHLVVARIKLPDYSCVTAKSVEDVFPGPDEDLLLKTLLDANPRPEGLYW